MAPPRNRRPGFSRRIQFGLFIGYVIAVIGVVCGLALVMLSRLDPAGFGQLRASALDASAPVTSGGRSVVTGIQAIGRNIGDYIQAGGQNEALRAEVKRSRHALIEAQAIRRQNLQLRRLLKLIDYQSQPVATARLIGSSRQTVTTLINELEQEGLLQYNRQEICFPDVIKFQKLQHVA